MDILNNQTQLLDACDVVYRIRSSASPTWYVLGYVSAAQSGDRRNITRRSEIGSNATFLLVDESQKSMTMQRLNVARTGGTAPHNRNLPAMIKWIVNGGVDAGEKIMIDIDDPAFNKPFDIEKTYYTNTREETGVDTNEAVSKTLYEKCKIAQLGINIGAASKYADDTIVVIWEKTINEDLGA